MAPLAGRRLDLEPAAVRLHDAIGDRQPEAGPLPRGLVVKNGSKIRARISGPIPWPSSTTWICTPLPRRQAGRTTTLPPRACVDRVGQQVEHDLVDLAGVAGQRRGGASSGGAPTPRSVTCRRRCSAVAGIPSLRSTSLRSASSSRANSQAPRRSADPLQAPPVRAMRPSRLSTTISQVDPLGFTSSRWASRSGRCSASVSSAAW